MADAKEAEDSTKLYYYGAQGRGQQASQGHGQISPPGFPVISGRRVSRVVLAAILGTADLRILGEAGCNWLVEYEFEHTVWTECEV